MGYLDGARVFGSVGRSWDYRLRRGLVVASTPRTSRIPQRRRRRHDLLVPVGRGGRGAADTRQGEVGGAGGKTFPLVLGRGFSFMMSEGACSWTYRSEKTAPTGWPMDSFDAPTEDYAQGVWGCAE